MFTYQHVKERTPAQKYPFATKRGVCLCPPTTPTPEQDAPLGAIDQQVMKELLQEIHDESSKHGM